MLIHSNSPLNARKTSELVQGTQGFTESHLEICKGEICKVHKPFWAISPGALTSQHKPTGISHAYSVQPLPLLDSPPISENKVMFYSVLFGQQNRARGRLLCSGLNNLCSLSLSLHFVLSNPYPSSWSSAGPLPASLPCSLVCLG